jgi:hypothetical protein
MENATPTTSEPFDRTKAFVALLNAAVILLQESHKGIALQKGTGELHSPSGVEHGRLEKLLGSELPESKASLLNGKDWYRLLVDAGIGLADWIGRAEKEYNWELNVPSQAFWTGFAAGESPSPQVDELLRKLIGCSSFFFSEASERWLKASK